MNKTTTKKCTKCGEIKDVGLFSKRKASKDGLTSKCKACVKAYCKANPEKIAAQRKAWSDANKEKVAAYNKAYKETNKDKLAAKCSAYRQANPEKVAAQRKAWNKANSDKNAARCKAYREANPGKAAAWQKTYNEVNKEKIAARQKAYKRANKEKLAAYRKAYAEANPEKIAASCKAWREANPGLVEMRNIIKRAERGVISALSVYGLPDRDAVKRLREGKLAIYRKHFGDEPCHLDHMEPLAGAKDDIDELHRRSHFSNLAYIPAKDNLSKGAKPLMQWIGEIDDDKLFECIAEQNQFNITFS